MTVEHSASAPDPLLRLTEAQVQRQHWRLVAMAMILPALAATVLLLIPMGGFASPYSDTMDPTSFIIFQVLYIIPAGILVSLYYREGMPGFGAVNRAVLVICGVVGCALFLAYIPVRSMEVGLGKTVNYKTIPTNVISNGIAFTYLFFALALDCCGKRSRHHIPTPGHPTTTAAPLSLTQQATTEEEDEEEGLLELDQCFSFGCCRNFKGQQNQTCDGDMSAPLVDRAGVYVGRTSSVMSKVFAMVPLTSALDFSPYYAQPSARLEREAFWGSALRMWLRLSLTWAGLAGMYLYCQAYIGLAGDERFQVMPLFLSFTLGLHFLRSLATRAARNCDKYRQSSVSVEVIIDMTGWSFYYLFYRNLFGMIETWESFVVVEILTIINELALYLLRLSDRFESFHSLQMLDKSWKGELYRLLSYDVKTELLVQRVCLDYEMRFSLLTTTGLAFMLYFTIIRFSFNEHFYKLAKHIPYEKTMLFLGLGLVVEVLLFVVIRSFAARRLRQRGLQSSVMSSWSNVIYVQPFYLVYFVVGVAHVISDTYISNMDISTLIDRSSSIAR